MVGFDRNGRGSVTNYLYGGGPVKYGLLNANNRLSGGLHEFGCVSDLQISLESQTQDHYCARTGTNVRDVQIVSQVGASLTFTADEFKFEAAQLWTIGNLATKSRPLVASVPATIKIWIPNPNYTGTEIEDNRPFARSYDLFTDGTVLEGGVWFSGVGAIAHTAANRIPSTSDASFSLLAITLINGVAPTSPAVLGTVEGITYSPETAEFYIAGEDFLDSDFADDINATAATNPYIELTLSTSGALPAKSFDSVIALTGTSKAIFLRYEGYNTESGQRVIVEIPRVKLLPQGNLALINTQNVGNLPFQGSIESNTAYTGQNGGYFSVTAIN